MKQSQETYLKDLLEGVLSSYKMIAEDDLIILVIVEKNEEY